jgi:cytochrome c-type biogenesis protein CcmH/NrfG
MEEWSVAKHARLLAWLNKMKHILAILAALGMSLVLSIGCASRHEPVVVDGAAHAGRDTARAKELNEQAFKLLDEAKYDQAEKLLRDAVAADAMFGPARNNLGLVYYHTDRLYEAAWEFENAIRLMPYQPEPRNNLGLVLERAGKLTTAADAYAKARELEPDNPQYIGNLARAKIRNGDHDEQTRALLQELVLKDSRPQWNDWARMNLFRLESRQSAGHDEGATTRP